jgi:hypothetical protein
MGQVVGEGLGCFRAAEALHPRSVEEVVDDARVILQQRRDFLHTPRNEGDPEFGQPFGLLADRGVQLRVLQVERRGGRITVIDTSNDVKPQVIRTDALGTFQDLKVSPDGTRLYGTSGGGLTVINTSTMTATAIPVGPTWNSQLDRNEYVNSVGSVAVSPDGKRAYVTFGATIAERGVGGQSNGSFFTDAQNVSWMVTGGYSGVSVIDTDPTSGNFNKEIARIIVPLGVHDLAASGSSLYVTSGDGKTVTVINTANNALAGIFTTDQTASGGRAIEIIVYPYGAEYPEYGIPVVSVTAFTRYITVGPTGTVYVTDYTDGKAYAVTVGTTAV